MVSSHNEAVPEAVPSNDIFPDTEASNTNVTTVKEEEDDEEMSRRLHEHYFMIIQHPLMRISNKKRMM